MKQLKRKDCGDNNSSNYLKLLEKFLMLNFLLCQLKLGSTNFAINKKLLKCKYYRDNNSSNYLQLFEKFLMLNSLGYKLNLTAPTSLSNETVEM